MATRAKRGGELPSGSESEGPRKPAEFVERVKGAEAEGGYEEETEGDLEVVPAHKKLKTGEGKGGGEMGGEGEEEEEEEEGGGPAPETPAEAGKGKQAGAATKGKQGAADTTEGAGGGAVEKGRIYFFYRPKVAVEEAAGLDDVQRFFMILQGEGGKARLGVVGKKRLPSVEKKERFFGFVEASADTVGELVQGLGSKRYETKTRGTREVGAARAVGEGTYAILEHHDHTHLAYKLEVPAEPGEVQEEFNIDKEGSFIITVKNPEHPAGGAVGLQEKADYSKEKRREFRHYAWIPVKDPQLLDYERCEFLLVGAADDLQAELGEGAEAAVEGAPARAGASCPDSDEECLLEAMKQEIGAEDVGIEMEPVETGEWK